MTDLTDYQKFLEKRKQWECDWEQRERHWFWQKGFWLLAGGCAFGALIVEALSR